MEINLKNVQGLWHEKGLTRKTPRRAVRRGKSTTPLIKAEHPHHVWSIDFQYDATRDGRVLKFVSMIDEFTRESLIDMVERSVNAAVALAKVLSAVLPVVSSRRCCGWITSQSLSPSADNACVGLVLAWFSLSQEHHGITDTSNHSTTTDEGSACGATIFLT